MTTRDYTQKMRGIASCLSYGGGEHEAAAKHTLLEAAHRLDTYDIRASRVRGRLQLTNGIGKTRLATWRERIAYRLFGLLPSQI